MTSKSYCETAHAHSISTANDSAHSAGQDPIRVLYFITAPFLGGVHVGLRNILRELDRSKFLPMVVQPEEQRKMLQFFDEVSVQTETIRSSRLSEWRWTALLDLLRATWDLCGLVRRHRIQILHSTAPRAAILCLLVKWFTGAKFVWQAAVLGHPSIMRWLARLPDRTTCVSGAVYEQMGGGIHANVQLLRNGVWAEALSEDQLVKRRRELRKELKIPDDSVVIGSVANLVYWKGAHILLQAFAGVLSKYPQAVLVHLGGPATGYEQYASDFFRLVEALGIRGHFLTLGFREDVHRYYSLFDLLVHVPIYEGTRGTTEAFGQQVAEAMAYRLPVIASRCGGPAEIVEDGVTGKLVEPGDIPGLARMILALLHDPLCRRTMGQAGFERYLRLFRIHREVSEYERVYLELVGIERHGWTAIPAALK